MMAQRVYKIETKTEHIVEMAEVDAIVIKRLNEIKGDQWIRESDGALMEEAYTSHRFDIEIKDDPARKKLVTAIDAVLSAKDRKEW
jgi:hypothetical protein